MANTSTADPHDDDLVPVKLPSGGNYYVYPREEPYFKERVKRYLADNHFTNVSDLQEVDRVVMLETLVWRWMTWLSSQKDYWFDLIDEKDLQRQIKDISGELRLIKAALGIDKVTRDKIKGEDSVHKYLENLKLRAREFGVMREEQLAKAIELFNDLKARMTLFDNCTEDERREQGITVDLFLEWIRTDIIPPFDAVDEHFRQSQQRFWMRDQ